MGYNPCLKGLCSRQDSHTLQRNVQVNDSVLNCTVQLISGKNGVKGEINMEHEWYRREILRGGQMSVGEYLWKACGIRQGYPWNLAGTSGSPGVKISDSKARLLMFK